MRLDLEAAGESGELARGSDHAVARRHNRDRIASVRSANSAHRPRTADLLRDLGVTSRFAEWDRQERVPDIALKPRPRKLQRQRKYRPRAGEILLELARGLDEHRMIGVLRDDVQRHAPRSIVFPQDRGQPFARRHQRKRSDRSAQKFVDVVLRCVGHGCSVVTFEP
jgi:hypothetical protein